MDGPLAELQVQAASNVFLLVSFPFISSPPLCHPCSENVSPHRPGTADVQQDPPPAAYKATETFAPHFPPSTSLPEGCQHLCPWDHQTGWRVPMWPPTPILAEPPPPCPMSATPSPPGLGLTGHMHVYLWCPDVLCRVPLLGCRCPTSSKWKGRDKGNNSHHHDAQGNVSF